jgi:hypothetical protein
MLELSGQTVGDGGRKPIHLLCTKCAEAPLTTQAGRRYEVKPTAEVKPAARAVQGAKPDPTDKPPAQAQPYPYYSDIAMTNLFNGYLSLINFERQALWQRYQAILLANSIILTMVSGFLKEVLQDRVEGKEPPQIIGLDVVAVVVFGMLLCVAWLYMTRTARKSFEAWVEKGKQFAWKGIGTQYQMFFDPINPLLDDVQQKRRTRILQYAGLIPVLFIFGYMHLFYRYADVQRWIEAAMTWIHHG